MGRKKSGEIKSIFFVLIFSFFLLKSLCKFNQMNFMNSVSEETKEAVQGNNRFSLELFSNIVKKEKGNVFFSPFSISSAFAMVYEGASGKTADEIRSAFHFQEESSKRRESWKNLLNKIKRKSKNYELFTANALWIHKDFKVLPAYSSTIEKYYGGEVSNLDFIGATERSRQTINKWVEEKTNRKIMNLFSPGSLNQLTRLVLTNAIYFKGEWLKQFDKEETKEENFWISKEKVVKVPMMKITGQNARFNYAETENLQILEMDYKGREFSMIVLLPKKDLQFLKSSLTEKNFRDWIEKLKEERVDVYFPKFKFNKKYTPNEILQEMGVKCAFIPGKADFSKIDGTKGLYIQITIHQAFVEVNEEGAEAGGATGIGIGITAVPVKKVFRADHPFIFIIQEKESGNILFIGKVIDPKE